jgi:hypothetical protein
MQIRSSRALILLAGLLLLAHGGSVPRPGSDPIVGSQVSNDPSSPVPPSTSISVWQVLALGH